MPIYVKDAVDNLMNETKITNFESAVWLSLQLGGIYILLSVLKGFFLFLMRQTIIIMSRLIEYDLKNEIFKHYEKLDLAFFKRNSTGDLMNRISEDVGLVRMYIGPGIMYTVNLVVLSAMIIFQMAQISGKLTFFVLLPLPIMSFLIYKVSSRINKMSKKVQEEQSVLSTIAQETFAGIRIIKAYNRDTETSEKFSNSTNEYKKRSMKLVITNALFMPTMVFLIGISTLATIYLGGLMTYDKQISLGGIVAFIFFVNNLTWPFASVGWVTSIIQRAAASQKRINEFLETKPEFENTNHSSFHFEGQIEFQNVTFVYPDTGIKALENLSFKINKGDTLAIVGRTGSGKSTILQLLMRQYHCSSGKILIDGKDIQNINSDGFRSETGIVPQDVFLFSDSIANNLKFGSNDSDISDQQLIEVTKAAHVYDNIINFPDKFETILGERGVNLSGGQKQRVSIARALLRNPKLLLLDDCLSAVDTETENTILGNLHKNHEQRTTIIVSHRISTIRNANYILLLDHGKVQEQGMHEELVSANGRYAEMYRKQLEK